MPKKEEAPLVMELTSDNSAQEVNMTVTAELVPAKKEKSKKARTVAIVGFAETSRMQVLTEPEDTEIWSLNRCYTFLTRWDRHFEVHEEDLYSGKTGLREANYLDLVRSWDCPIYMLHPDSTIPNAVQFPKNEIIDMFRDYFTTSIAYMLALVAFEHRNGDTVAEMHIYGVDMSAFSEYSEQLPCVNFWLGVLEGLGIKVVIPSASPLLKCAMQYGRQGEKPLQKMAKERLAHHKERQAQLVADGAAVTGASAEYGNIFPVLDNLIIEVEKSPTDATALVNGFKEACKTRRNEINQFHAQLNADLNSELGALRESQHWIVALNAAQTVEEEPEPAKLPKV